MLDLWPPNSWIGTGFSVSIRGLVSLKWPFKSSLKEHLPDASASDSMLRQAMSCAAWQPKYYPEARMQIERINVRSDSTSVRADLWEVDHLRSRGQQVWWSLFFSWVCHIGTHDFSRGRGWQYLLKKLAFWFKWKNLKNFNSKYTRIVMILWERKLWFSGRVGCLLLIQKVLVSPAPTSACWNVLWHWTLDCVC